MPNQTPLDVQYPLSPRKFWKKMSNMLIGWAFVELMLIAFGWALNQSLFLYGLPLFLLHFMLRGWYVKAYIRTYFYDANEAFVTIKKGVFAPREIHVQFSKIQDVYVDQDIIDRTMGLYDVHLASATVASGMEAHIDGVESQAATALKELLLARVQGASVGTANVPAAAPAPVAAPSAQPVAFSQDISTRTYPIVKSWFVVKGANSLWRAALYTVAVIFLVSGNDNRANGTGGTSGSALVAYTIAHPMSVLGLVIIIFLALLCAELVYFALWRANFSFEFLPDYIVRKKGIIAKSEEHVPYRSVQDVWISQSVLERLFGLATVTIQNAAQGGRAFSLQIPGQPLAKANEITDALKRVTIGHSAAGTGL